MCSGGSPINTSRTSAARCSSGAGRWAWAPMITAGVFCADPDGAARVGCVPCMRGARLQTSTTNPRAAPVASGLANKRVRVASRHRRAPRRQPRFPRSPRRSRRCVARPHRLGSTRRNRTAPLLSHRPNKPDPLPRHHLNGGACGHRPEALAIDHSWIEASMSGPPMPCPSRAVPGLCVDGIAPTQSGLKTGRPRPSAPRSRLGK
jgi:hypothetical protein